MTCLCLRRTDVLKLTCLLLLLAGRMVAAAELPPIPYTTACGPIAMLSCLRSQGVDTTISKLVSQCNWKEGKLTTLQEMQSTLAGYPGLEVAAVRISPEQLVDFVKKGGSAIAAVRKGASDINHAVTIVAASEMKITYIDYPELVQVSDLDSFQNVWDGQAILVMRKDSMAGFKWFVLPSVCAAMVLFFVWGRIQLKTSG